jgi:hypothetical protein
MRKISFNSSTKGSIISIFKFLRKFFIKIIVLRLIVQVDLKGNEGPSPLPLEKMLKNSWFLLFVLFKSLFGLDVTTKGDNVDSQLPLNHRADSNVSELFLNELKQNQSQQLATLNYFIENGVCKHFYWDMGTNIGIQLRKLYEPQFFPRAAVIPFFARLFGDESPSGKMHDNVCAIGFEPGHIHVPRLLALQDAYQKAGYPLVILTSTAVWNENGNITFYDDHYSNKVHNEWGSSVLNYNKQMEAHPTLAVDIDHLVHHVMYTWDKTTFANYNPKHDLTKDPFSYHNEQLTKTLPYFHALNPNNKHSFLHHRHSQQSGLHSGKQHYFDSKTSKMIAKVDIEGAEFTILPHMALHGSLCFFDEMMIEWHSGFVTKEVAKSVMDFLTILRKKPKHDIRNCRFHIDDLDDETYGDGADMNPLPLPVVHAANSSSDTSEASSTSLASSALRRKMKETTEEELKSSDRERPIDVYNNQKKIEKLLRKKVKFLRLIRVPDEIDNKTEYQ